MVREVRSRQIAVRTHIGSRICPRCGISPVAISHNTCRPRRLYHGCGQPCALKEARPSQGDNAAAHVASPHGLAPGSSQREGCWQMQRTTPKEKMSALAPHRRPISSSGADLRGRKKGGRVSSGGPVIEI